MRIFMLLAAWCLMLQAKRKLSKGWSWRCVNDHSFSTPSRLEYRTLHVIFHFHSGREHLFPSLLQPELIQWTSLVRAAERVCVLSSSNLKHHSIVICLWDLHNDLPPLFVLLFPSHVLLL